MIVPADQMSQKHWVTVVVINVVFGNVQWLYAQVIKSIGEFFSTAVAFPIPPIYRSGDENRRAQTYSMGRIMIRQEIKRIDKKKGCAVRIISNRKGFREPGHVSTPQWS